MQRARPPEKYLDYAESLFYLQLKPKQVQSIISLFDYFDINKDGRLSMPEYRHMQVHFSQSNYIVKI